MKDIDSYNVRHIISSEMLTQARWGPEAHVLHVFRKCLTDLFQSMPPALDFEQGFKDHDLVILVRAVPKKGGFE